MAQTKDGNEYLGGKRMTTEKMPQFDRNFLKDGYPEQYVRDKAGKNKAWNVLHSCWNPVDSSVTYEVLVNPHETDVRTITKEEICYMFSWKDFKFTAPVGKTKRNKMVKPEDIDNYCVVRVMPIFK